SNRRKNQWPAGKRAMLYSVVCAIGQIEDLTGVDAVGIADLAGIGLIDGRVFDAFAIDPARDGPEVVAAANNRLAGSKALIIDIADTHANHGRHSRLSGSSVWWRHGGFSWLWRSSGRRIGHS